jgi:DNA polymerase III subunit epsilon
MKLQLKKPLAFLDLESTGINPMHDRIVEICVLVLEPDGTRTEKTRRINPQIPISPSATEVHGITDSDVADEPTFKQLATGFIKFLGDADLAGYNIHRFDLPLLKEEFKRAGTFFEMENRQIIDVMRIFHKKEPRDLAAASLFYLNKKFEDHHQAAADVLVTADILEAQLEHYSDLPTEIGELAEYSTNRNPNWIDPEGKFHWEGEYAVFGFGKYRGITLSKIAETDINYIRFLSGKDFSEEACKILKDAIDGVFPEKTGG